MKELVLDKNPDTDAIVAAKAYSYLQNKLGADTEAVALGTPNEETNLCWLLQGRISTCNYNCKNEVEAVMLVDHNEAQQSVTWH